MLRPRLRRDDRGSLRLGGISRWKRSPRTPRPPAPAICGSRPTRPTEFIDLTDRLEALVAEAGVRSGFVNVQTLHTTTAIVVNEHEPLLLADFAALLEQAAPGGAGYRARRRQRPHGEPDARRAAQRSRALPGAAARPVGLSSTSSTAGCCSGAGSACSWSSSTVRGSRDALGAASSARRPADEGQDDPAGADRSDEPVLAADQVLAVSAARPGHAGRRTCATTTRSRFRTSTSSGSTSTTRPTWSSSRSTSRRRAAPIASPTTTARAARTSCSAACTSRRCRRRRPRTRTRSSSGPARTPGRSFLADYRARRAGAASISRTIAHARRAAADPARSDQAAPLSRAELDRRLARLSARLRLLLQGGVLRGRPRRSTRRPSTTALAEIERLPGRHLYFLDDHLFGDRRFATALFDGMRGMGRLWQAAGTVNCGARRRTCSRQAVAAGLRSLFVGFETLNPANLRRAAQVSEPAPRLRRGDPAAARPRRDDQRQLRLRHGRRRRVGVRADGGMGDRRRASRPRRSTSSRRIPAPRSTGGLPAQGRITYDDWDLLRHAPRRVPPARDVGGDARSRLLARLSRLLPLGIDRPRRRGARRSVVAGLRHFAYAAGLEEVRAAVGSRHPREARRR